VRAGAVAFQKQSREPGGDFGLDPFLLDFGDFIAKLRDLIQAGELKSFKRALGALS
jgi:hypothetical protein